MKSSTLTGWKYQEPFKLATLYKTSNGWRGLGFLDLNMKILNCKISEEEGYNSAVECHFDVVKVISSSLIIPKFINLYFFLFRY